MTQNCPLYKAPCSLKRTLAFTVLMALIAIQPVPSLARDPLTDVQEGPLPTAKVSTKTMPGPRIKLGTHQVLSGQFIHEHPVQGFDQPMRTEGRFSVGPSNRIIWAIQKPMATTTTITSDGLMQQVGAYTLLNISSQKMPFLTEIQEQLILALSGQWDALKDEYSITSTGTASQWTATIVPKDKPGQRKPFSKIVAKGSKYVDRADIVLPSGITDRVAFSGVALQ